jgi:hypothetical protein
MDDSSQNRMRSKLVLAAGVAAAAIVLAVVVILATRPPEPSASAPAAAAPEVRPTQPLSPMETATFGISPRESDQPQPDPNASWEEKLDVILTSEGSNSEAVRRLLQEFNRLPPEAQTEYIAHALNLCEDEDFGSVEGIYLQSGTPTEVSEQIFDDALNRPDELKLPLMARTMTTSNHPMQEQAREILCLYLDLDPDTAGTVDWSARTRQYLHENPAIE